MIPEPDPNALDAGQYTHDSIRKYEAIYGRNFISPGGQATTLDILALTDMTPGMRVLDVGCGLGGAALLMAQRFGARVHGIDLSQNMLQLAQARCQEAQLTQAVTFEHADILEYNPSAIYDLVHSRDAFLHIHEKGRLFAALARCLRPGGRVLFSDYLCPAGPPSPDFAAYIRARHYDLCSLEAYRAHLAQVGFTVILAEDRTDDFIAILERELDQLHASQLPTHERDDLADSWQAKLQRARAGEQRWGIFIGQKG
ncbi:MAG: methyltransferase domain-containing protein [Roseiflexaceae bacterium]